MSDTEKCLDAEKARLVMEWFKGNPQAPFSMEISPTMLCNVNCRFCRQKDEVAGRRRPVRELSDERWFKIIHEAVSMGTRRLLFRGGGEPTLRKRLLTSLFPLVKSHGPACALLTNGILIDKCMAEQLVVSGWNEVIISLPAGDAVSYEYIVDEPGTFHKVNLALRWLKHFKDLHASRTPVVSFHVVLTKRTYRELDKIVRLAADYGIAHIGVFPMHDTPDAALVKDLKMTEDDETAYRKLAPDYRKLMESLRISCDFQLSYQTGTDRKNASGSEINDKRRQIPCYFPWFHAAVTPDGSLSPCCYGEGFRSGITMETTDFKKAWLDCDMADYRSAITKGIMMPFCVKCPDWYKRDNERLRELLPGMKQ